MPIMKGFCRVGTKKAGVDRPIRETLTIREAAAYVLSFTSELRLNLLKPDFQQNLPGTR